MPPSIVSSSPKLRCAAIAAALLLAGAAHAQIYRIVGPDGKVTYSDKPPAANAREALAGGNAATGARSEPTGLPYQLQQTLQRYPVTVYTSGNCSPCNSGRNLLINRGVPFTEKTIESNNDAMALQRQFGGSDLPVLTIGAQRLSGFSDTEWSQYLDAAGYPKTSQLPSAYRRPAPTPLAGPDTARPPQPAPAAPPQAAAQAPAAAPEPSVAPPTGASNPAGIRF